MSIFFLISAQVCGYARSVACVQNSLAQKKIDSDILIIIKWRISGKRNHEDGIYYKSTYITFISHGAQHE